MRKLSELSKRCCGCQRDCALPSARLLGFNPRRKLRHGEVLAKTQAPGRASEAPTLQPQRNFNIKITALYQSEYVYNYIVLGSIDLTS